MFCMDKHIFYIQKINHHRKRIPYRYKKEDFPLFNESKIYIYSHQNLHNYRIYKNNILNILYNPYYTTKNIFNKEYYYFYYYSNFLINNTPSCNNIKELESFLQLRYQMNTLYIYHIIQAHKTYNYFYNLISIVQQ